MKLWQVDPEYLSHVRIDTGTLGAAADAARPGVTIAPLFQDTHEVTRMELWAPGTTSTLGDAGEVEALVLSGTLTFQDRTLPAWSWLRLPKRDAAPLKAGPVGAHLWIKKGHLRDAAGPNIRT